MSQRGVTNPAPRPETPGSAPAAPRWGSEHLLLWVGEGERPWRGLVCPLPPRRVLTVYGLLGEEGLGDRGGELEGAGLRQL